MNKKTVLTLILVIFVALIAGLFFVYSTFSARTAEEGGFVSNLSNFFPFGSTPSDTPTNPGDPANPTVEATPAPRLRQVSQTPVAGMTFVDLEEGIGIRYLEKATGHIFETPATSTAIARISNTTIPKIQEVLWESSGDVLILRYLNDAGNAIESFYGVASTTEGAETGSLTGEFLEQGIVAMTVSPEQDSVFYLTAGASGAVGIAADFDGRNKVELLDSPLAQWLIDWPSTNRIALTTKPSSGVTGHLFYLNTRTGGLERVLSGVGLTALVNPTGSSLLFSESSGTDLALTLQTEQGTTALSISTLPEKCVWATSGDIAYCGAPSTVIPSSYPDNWYAGLVSFEDSIWKIDARNGMVELVLNLTEEAGTAIDVYSPILSADGAYLVFINKNDSTLWSLQLNEEGDSAPQTD